MSYQNKNPHFKSCIRTYNNGPQEIKKSKSTLTLKGEEVVNTGCSLSLNPEGIVVKRTGLFHLSVDVTITPQECGTFSVQLFLDGNPLPCSLSQNASEARKTFTTHLETDQFIPTCQLKHPKITVVTYGVAGTIEHLCVGALKLA